MATSVTIKKICGKCGQLAPVAKPDDSVCIECQKKQAENKTGKK